MTPWAAGCAGPGCSREEWCTRGAEKGDYPGCLAVPRGAGRLYPTRGTTSPHAVRAPLSSLSRLVPVSLPDPWLFAKCRASRVGSFFRSGGAPRGTHCRVTPAGTHCWVTPAGYILPGWHLWMGNLCPGDTSGWVTSARVNTSGYVLPGLTPLGMYCPGNLRMWVTSARVTSACG